MSVVLDIQVDTADVSRLRAQADRNRAVLGKGMRESIQWAGVMLAKSLAARTKVSAKKREVVDMPIQRVTKAGEVDRRYAPWGFKKWVTSGDYASKGTERGPRHLVILPLYRHGRFGIEKFKTKSEASKAPRVRIGRSGLAKKSWGWAAHNMITGGSGRVYGIPDVAVIRWEGGYIDPSVRITNRLRYMEKALEGGFSAVQSAIDAAANKMEHEIGRKAAEAYGAS